MALKMVQRQLVLSGIAECSGCEDGYTFDLSAGAKAFDCLRKPFLQVEKAGDDSNINLLSGNTSSFDDRCEV